MSGRRTDFTLELAAEICRQLCEGMTLNEICRAADMPAASTVRGWAYDDREGFSSHYERARQIGYHTMADELIEIADDARNDWVRRRDGTKYVDREHIARSELRAKMRQWLLAKALPRIYGEKVTQEHVIRHDARELSDDELAGIVGTSRTSGPLGGNLSSPSSVRTAAPPRNTKLTH